MNDSSTDPPTHNPDEDLEALEAADPADAPSVAEELADRLARELDGAPATQTPGPEDRS